MMQPIKLVLLLLLPVLFPLSGAPAQTGQPPSCAVLTFTAGPGIEVRQISMLANRYAVLLDKTGKFNVMPRYEMNRILMRLGSRTLNDISTGKALNVDLVISGTVEMKDGKYWLNTIVSDIKSGSTVKRINTFYAGELLKFLEMAPQGNINVLTGKKTPATTPEQPAPSIARQPVRTKPTTAVKPSQTSPHKYSSTTKPEPKDIPAITDSRSWIRNRMEIGLNITHFFLLEREKDSFLGSINMLKEDQTYFPYPFISARIHDRIWLRLGYDRLRAITWTKAEIEYNEPGYTDGTVELAGALLSAIYRFPLEDITLSAEAGVAFLQSSFIHDPAWRDARGHENSHIMKFYDTTGAFIAAEGEIQLHDHWYMTCNITYTRVEADMTYYLYDRKRTDKTFPLSNIAFGFGIKYNF